MVKTAVAPHDPEAGVRTRSPRDHDEEQGEAVTKVRDFDTPRSEAPAPLPAQRARLDAPATDTAASAAGLDDVLPYDPWEREPPTMALASADYHQALIVFCASAHVPTRYKAAYAAVGLCMVLLQICAATALIVKAAVPRWCVPPPTGAPRSHKHARGHRPPY